MAVNIITGVGRIVWGHPTEARDKTQKNQATGRFEPVFKDGVKVQQWTFGVAFPRAEFESLIWPAMAAEAATLYPGGTPPPKFAWKYKDGDKDVDDDGKPYSLREGYAGHIVLTVSTELKCPEIFKFNGTGYDQLPGEAIKCGDYVVLGLALKANVPTDRTQTPGMYVNPTVVEFVGYGTKIVPQGAVNPMDVLGGRAHALPPGATAAPQASVGAPGMPQMPAMAPPAGMPAMAPPVAPVMAPPPPPAPVAPAVQRPTDPSHIHAPGTPGEQWWVNGAWTPAVAAPTMPPPAPDFVQNAGMPQMPTMPGR